METNSDIATEILKSISCLLKDEKLADFTIVLDDLVFKCHRFILAACSRFFYALFTTDMMEKMDNSARLQDIESSAFELVLKVLYTGKNVLNKENVFSIWQCAHMLQIPFLVQLCENFTISILSTENYADCSRMATMLDSTTVLECVEKFILKNFMQVKDDKFFLELSEGKLLELIQNDALEVTSEDDVLLFIYKWVENSPKTGSGFKSQNETNNWDSGFSDIPADTLKDNAVATNVEPIPEKKNYGTNSNEEISIPNKNILEMHKPVQDRSGYLQTLLKASRSCLASTLCLQTLYHHRLTQSDEVARKVIFDAIVYQGKGYLHGYFPPAALHRNSSELEQVFVYACGAGDFHALSLARNKFLPMPTCTEIKNKIKIALFDYNIYAVGQVDDSTSKLCVLKESSWVSIAELPGLRYFLLSHKSYLYVFNVYSGKVLRVNPNSFDKNPKKLERPSGLTDMKFALSFNEYILVFSKDSVSGREETVVHVMNTLDETWHRHDNLDGPAKKMASFQDGDKVYLLQNNGNLWLISRDDAQMITFHFIKKIWEDKERLRGALLYKDTLFLFRMIPLANPGGKLLESLPGVYKSVKTWTSEVYSSNFIFTVMHNLDMVKT